MRDPASRDQPLRADRGVLSGADRSSLDSDQIVEYTLLWTEMLSRRPGHGRRLC